MTKSFRTQLNKAIFSGAPPFFAIITYPKAEESAILRQALMAHVVAILSIMHSDGRIPYSKTSYSVQTITITSSILLRPNQLKIKKRVALDVVLLIEDLIVPWILEIISDFLGCMYTWTCIPYSL